MINKIILSTLVLTAGLFGSSEDIDELEMDNSFQMTSKLKKEDGAKQSIDFGFSNTTGNTETLNLNAEYNFGILRTGISGKDLIISFSARAFLSENNEIRDNEEYTLNLDLEQKYNDNYFVYLSSDWLKNKFLNYDNKYLIGAGVGSEVFKSEKQFLKLRLGMAYNTENYTDLTDTKRYTSFTQFIEYNYTFNKVSSFGIQSELSENFDDIEGDYQSLTLMSFKFIIAENLHLIVQEEIRYNSTSTTDKKTDTKSIVKVGYSF